ncbi:MAG: hypothetical protein MUC50_11335 [Myxococcota bacterium]|jgi:hypothetical protein|nr:hypothetical protein [Myxococcota bacterium]
MTLRIWAILTAALCLCAIAGCGRQVKSIDVEPIKLSFNKLEQSEKIKAVARDSHGGQVEGIAFQFRSENERVARVESNGAVKPTGNGSTAIIVESHEGVRGEAFVEVCLPGEIQCDLKDKLLLRVGSGAPLRCVVSDCKGEKLSQRVDLKAADETMLLKDDISFIGLKVGATEVVASALGLSKKIPVQVDEQTFAPGMGPGSNDGRGIGGGTSGSKQDKDTQVKGAYDHILNNMKVSPD